MKGESIRHAVTVELPIEEAFAHFVDDLGEWWPQEYTWSQDDLEEIGMKPRPGGVCFERDQQGTEREWGRLNDWEPPQRIRFSWRIGPEREQVAERDASQVEVRFEEANGAKTRVELEHRDFERYGVHASAYREALASDEGWPLILERYAVSG